MLGGYRLPRFGCSSQERNERRRLRVHGRAGNARADPAFPYAHPNAPQAAIAAIDVAAGLSLGEYTALAFAGAMRWAGGGVHDLGGRGGSGGDGGRKSDAQVTGRARGGVGARCRVWQLPCTTGSTGQVLLSARDCAKRYSARYKRLQCRGCELCAGLSLQQLERSAPPIRPHQLSCKAGWVAGSALVPTRALSCTAPPPTRSPSRRSCRSVPQTTLPRRPTRSFEDGLRLVKLRGESMQAAADAQPSSMVSVIGLDSAKVAELCKVGQR